METIANSKPMSSSNGISDTPTRRFRYSYLCRLIDDSELQNFEPAIRAELRRVHKQTYWKNLSLLRRDAARVLKFRRERMSAQQEWDFAALVNDYAHVQYLLATLTLAGVSHATRVSVGLERARVACAEFEKLLTSSPLLAPTAA